MNNLDKLPYNLEAEKLLLGGILINQDFFGEVNEIISYEDFYSEEHSIIFEAMNYLYINNKTIDPLLVEEQLKQILKVKKKNNKKLDYNNIKDILSSIIDEVSSTVNLINYTEVIKEKSINRKLIKICSKIIDDAFSGDTTSNDLIDSAEKNILSLSNKNDKKELYSMNDLGLAFLEKSDEIRQRKGSVLGIPTSYIDLDKKINGLNKSDLIILAARPAIGKTAFALNILLNVAKLNKSVLFISLEMPAEQIYNRLLSIETGIELSKITNRHISDPEWDTLGMANTLLGNLNINITNSGEKIIELRALARKLKSFGELDLIVLDYLQLMNSKNPENRQQEISEISRNLKKLAIELNIPIIALSQLSRSVETRQEKRPVLSDLRESGAIEQDADIVMFLYRDEYYNPNTLDKGIAELIIGKHRNGEIGTIKFNFIGKSVKFTSFTDQIK